MKFVVMAMLVCAVAGCQSSSPPMEKLRQNTKFVGIWRADITGPDNAKAYQLEMRKDGNIVATWRNEQDVAVGTYTGIWEPIDAKLAKGHTNGGSDGTFELIDADTMRMSGDDASVALHRVK